MDKLIKKAKHAGANAVKTQKRDNRSLYTRAFFNKVYDNPNSFAKTYGEHREKLEFTLNQHKKIKTYCKKINIESFTSVWDLTSAREILKSTKAIEQYFGTQF